MSDAVWQPPSLAELAAMLPQFEFLELIGAGGMGAVYKARQITLDRLVAIKVMPPYADDGSGAKFVERFINEARVMAKLMHVCIVSVYDFGQMSDGHLYLAMEYVEGSDVQDLIDHRGKLKPAEALAITAQVCDALQYAHSRGVTHRDIKPANVLISREGYIKVVDFGLAKAAHLGTIDHPEVTMGTPAFMAPEVLHSEERVDGRSDLFSVGAMLYNMLTGKQPEGTFWPASQIALCDPRFDRIIKRAMEADPKKRYQQANEIRRDLDEIASTPMVEKGQKGLSVVANVQTKQTGIVKKKIPAAKIAPLKKTAAGTPAKSAYVAPKKPAPEESSNGVLIAVILVLLLAGGGGLWWYLANQSEETPSAPPAGPVVVAQPQAQAQPDQTPQQDPAAKPEVRTKAAKGISQPAAAAAREIPADGSWLNILPLVKVTRDAKKFSADATAAWQNESGILKFAKEPEGVVGMIPPIDLPDCYEVSVLSRVPAEGSSCGILLPVGERHINLRAEINARGHPIGLEMIDGEMLANSPAVAAGAITLEVEHTLAASVGLQNSNVVIEVHVDGRAVFTWSGRETSLRPAPKWDHATPHRLAFVSDSAAATWSDAKIRRIASEDVAAVAPIASEIVTLAGHRYQFVPAKLTWPEAKARAESLNGHLATITTTNEDEFIRTSFARFITVKNSAFWIGLAREDSASGWRWVTGEPFSYSNWGKGEPNAESNGGAPPFHVCYARRGAADIKWADTVRDHQEAPAFVHGLLVEWDSTNAATASATGTVETRLATIAGQFTALRDEKIMRPHKQSLAELNGQYAEALDRTMKTAAPAGSADELKWKSEKSRIESGKPMPEIDGEMTPAGIKKLRATFRPQFAKLDADRAAKLKPWYDRYDQVLADMQAEYSRAGKTAETAAVKTRRDEIAAQRAAALPPAAQN